MLKNIISVYKKQGWSVLVLLPTKVFMKFFFFKTAHQRFFKKMDNRKALALDDYNKILKPFNSYFLDPIQQNNYYGNAKTIKDFIKDKQSNSHFEIEHGAVLVFNEEVTKNQFNTDPPNAYLVMGAKREDFYKKFFPKMNIKAIGPYIHYSPLIYDNETVKKKKEALGRNLLIFPSHSTITFDYNYETKQLKDEVDRIGEDFDTISLCFYWKDILSGKHNAFVGDSRYQIVTAGHIYDPHFLSRLKTIIYLSDCTASNAIGTHIGYSLYLNKPHRFISQNIETKISQKNWKAEYLTLNKSDWDIRLEKSNHLFKKTFELDQWKITKDQLDLCNEYWGFDQIKSPDQLRKIISQQKQ